ncbi:hypothetical protein [Microbacterium aurantiacum]|uniref:hypothetical protein n=1 Tax=Microbacterium aurantiacum TaxID=162393 RepID=UPI003D7556AF
MTDAQLQITPRLARVLMSEEAIYGLILVSGMIVVSGSVIGTSVNAFLTVAVTVVVFYIAHVYAGTLGRLAATDGRSGMRRSLRAAARQSAGMLVASAGPLVVLLLGVTEVIDDTFAIWTALVMCAVILGILGWLAVARWTHHWYTRLLSATITAGFGGAIILLKAIIHH